MEGAFEYWRARGFPHYDLTESDVKREYEILVNQPPTSISSTGIVGSTVGLRLANFFQPQMWSVRVSRYLSPYDIFTSDSHLKAAIERSWRIWPDRIGANPATLRRILKTFPGTASVSNFRPTVVRSVVTRFCPKNGLVVDFSAGYGGRLLGTISVERRYVGIEPCAAQLKGLKRMQVALNESRPRGDAEVVKGCAEDLMPLLSRGSADLIFSSPPYFDWEKYSHDKSQSFVRYPTYEAWREGFLHQILRESARVLRRGGHLVLNVSDGRRKPNAQEVTKLCKAVGLRYKGYVPLMITRVPYMHPRNERPHKSEVLLVFVR